MWKTITKTTVVRKWNVKLQYNKLFEEYRVAPFNNDCHDEGKTYYTDDKGDANATYVRYIQDIHNKTNGFE